MREWAIRACLCVCRGLAGCFYPKRFMTTFLHVSKPPLLAGPPTKTLSVSVSLSLFCLGGLRHTTGGCKSWIWVLLTSPLHYGNWLRWIGRASPGLLSSTGPRPNGSTVSVSLIVTPPAHPSLFLLLSRHFTTSFSWMSSLCPAAFLLSSISGPTGEGTFLAIFTFW